MVLFNKCLKILHYNYSISWPKPFVVKYYEFVLE